MPDFGNNYDETVAETIYGEGTEVQEGDTLHDVELRETDSSSTDSDDGFLSSDTELGFGSGTSDEPMSGEEPTFGLKTGRYRNTEGEFVDGSPPSDFNSKAHRFQGNDGKFKNRTHDEHRRDVDNPADDSGILSGFKNVFDF
jgi:hypothetical protein